MPCEWYRTQDGTVIHVNRGASGGKKKICRFCRTGKVEKLCDFPIGHGRTCDAEICASCATTKGTQHTDVGHGLKRLNDTFDVCPIHSNEPLPSNLKEAF
jgi:hypothetical protein